MKDFKLSNVVVKACSNCGSLKVIRKMGGIICAECRTVIYTRKWYEMKALTFNLTMALAYALCLILLASCADTEPTVAPKSRCDNTIQAPANRVGAFDGFYFTTKPAAELHGCLPTPASFAQANYFRVLYSVRLTNVAAGDVINFTGKGEVSNENPYDILIDQYVILSATPTSTTGIQLTQPTGYNLTPQMHHGPVADSGYYQFVSDYDEVYINFVIYSAGARVEEANLIIEQGYGGMSGTVTRRAK